MPPARGAATPTPVYLELGPKRVFACAVDWPGWCRSGRDEQQALAALTATAARFAVVASAAGADLPAGATFEVTERVKGSSTTDFGAPGSVPELDRAPTTRGQAERLAAFVAASWRVLDSVVAGAPAELRKGPRGGGRDRDAIAQHVLNAEAAYARKIGVRAPAPPFDDAAAVQALRNAVLDVLGTPWDGELAGPKGWPPRYAARRIAWHAVDHAWEIEDRSD